MAEADPIARTYPPTTSAPPGHVRDKQEYVVWYGMRLRCRDPLSPSYYGYGGRGIDICQRWYDSFDAFMADMGPRPSKEHSLDRIDNNGHYEPDNCRWATKEQQARNARGRRMLVSRGERKCVADWADTSGTPAPVISARLRLGWSDDDAIWVPARKQSRMPTHITPEQVLALRETTGSWKAVAKALGCTYSAVKHFRERNEMPLDGHQTWRLVQQSAKELQALYDRLGTWQAVVLHLGVSKPAVLLARRKRGMAVGRGRDF